MNDDSITIVQYNPRWPQKAQNEITKLKKLFKNNKWIKDIQHIGSTAVPGLSAKPIIDIYIGVDSIILAQQLIVPIENLGYKFWEENPNNEKMFFVKGMPPFGKKRTHHIHIVEYNSSYWKARILFRDYLINHSDEAMQYERLKKELMIKYTYDREKYTDEKSHFIASVLRKAGFTEIIKR